MVAEEEAMAICALMRSLAPYSVLSLRFPDIAAPEQLRMQQEITGKCGIALDFVVDTQDDV